MNESSFTNPWIQLQQTMFNEMSASLGRMSSMATLAQKAQRIRKGVSPSEVVYEEDNLKIRHYISDKPAKVRTPIVFVYALVNRPYILDLKKGRSVIANFVERGFDTYLVDWGIPTHMDRHLRLDDYINGYLVNVMDFLAERCGVDQLNVLGYCMGGTLSSMFTALHPKRVKNLALLATPIDFATREGLLNIWADHFDVDKFVDAFGNCPPELLQAGFLMLKPIGNLVEKPINFYEHMNEEKFIDDFLTTEGWLNDNIPVPGEAYREFIKYLYQQNSLTQNRMPIGKHIVDLKNITCPVLNIMADKDDLVPCSQTLPFTELVGSKDRKNLVLRDGGHIGLAIGGKAQRELWPQACDWFAQRS